MSTPETATPAPCACRCDDAPDRADKIRFLADFIRAENGRWVDGDLIASVMAVRSGDRVEVVAHLHPVTLATCDIYAEARALQERVQAWLDGGGA